MKRTDRLFVNLSASQVRKRLKGFGHGVRKVEATGRNQSVIVHTATGRHLAELENLFSDVGPSEYQENRGEPVVCVRNLGSTSADWLNGAGIRTRAELERVGPVVAYQMVKHRHPGASLNLLWAMVAGLQDRDWRDLSREEKEQVLKQLSLQLSPHVDTGGSPVPQQASRLLPRKRQHEK